jgi:SAM-dependent MidA family methyltransferase
MDGFVELAGDPSTPEIDARLADVMDSLPDGFRGEICLDLDRWAGQAAGHIDRGFVITIDFGFDREVLYSPQRRAGTLRCYYRHTVNADPFIRVGDQDMAAHVDFSEVDATLGRRGFQSLGHTTQGQFLRRLGADSFLARLHSEVASPSEAARNRAAILELVKPEGLGRFRVALHSKGVGAPRLEALAGDPQGLPLPLLAPGDPRVPVLEGRYPHAVQEFTGSWDDLLS